MFAFVKEYTSFGSDIDLRSEPPANADAGRVSRFEVVDAGSGGLALRMQENNAGVGVDVALTSLTAGDVQLSPDKILASGTTVAKVRVWWNRKN